MGYLRWSKVHRKVRYELTDSGTPAVDRHVLGPRPQCINLDVRGTYGDPELIDALAERYRVAPDGVVPVPGTSSANFMALAAVLQHGDAVLVEHPVYDPISRVAAFLGLRVIPLRRRPSSAFGIRVEEVEAGLKQGARAVVLTNLHNPSGQLLTVEMIERIAESCAIAGAKLVVDEVYLDAVHLAGLGPLWTAANVADNVIATSSLTKVYGLGGLRIGWLLTNPGLAERARGIMDLLSVNNSAPSSSLALVAFSQMERLEARFRRFYQEGQPVFRRWLAEQSTLTGYDSNGAIFECLRLPKGVTSVELNELLVTEYDAQVVPGRFFDLDDHIRVSIALPSADLAEGLSRVSQAVTKLVSKG
jgi:aspartate/methionine/tyrosine aminotransferase